MPVGEERTITPIGLSDGTLLFMYYKYPLLQAFGGVLAEPIVTLHEGPEYRIRYVSRDAEGRDRLDGARPIVTRDWKRSKWLNEFLVGLDELRLMGSLGGLGGPENELYRILSDPKYREHLACYASKFPDESGSRLIVLNWVGPLAKAPAVEVIPAAPRPRAKVVSPPATRVSVEPAAPQKAKSEPSAPDRPSTFIPLAHQVSQDPPAPPAEAPRAGVEPGVAAAAPHKKGIEEAGTQKLSLDTTQPVPIEQLATPQPRVEPQAPRQPTGGPPAASEASVEPEVTQKAKIEPPAPDLPSTVVPLAHQATAKPPAAPPVSVEPDVTQTDQPLTVTPLAHQASPDHPVAPHSAAAPGETSEPPIEQLPSIELQRPIERDRSILPSGAVRSSGAAVRPSSVGRPGAAGAGRASSRPSSWMIAVVAVFGFSLLLVGWWLRSTGEQPTEVASPPATRSEGAEIVTAGVATSEPDLHESSPQGSPLQDDGAPGTMAPGGDATQAMVESGDEDEPPRELREQLEQQEAAAVQIASSEPEPEPQPTPPVPERSPNPQPPSPAPAAIDAPLLAQGGKPEESAPQAVVQGWEGEVPDDPPGGNDSAAQAPPLSDAAVAPEPAPAPVEPPIPTLKITSEQMNAAQRTYLARVIRFLEPPLVYEWTPKFTRPAFFTSLVTDGEPPECRIDFKEPTTITFDLVIRGGSGTESRIEDVEIIY